MAKNKISTVTDTDKGETKVSPFQQTIQDYLDKKAADDSLFAKTYAKKNKSIERCCSFIFEEMRKLAQNGMAVARDEQVYGLAVHYYDEDDLSIDKKSETAIMAVNQSVKSVASPASEKQDGKTETKTVEFSLF